MGVSETVAEEMDSRRHVRRLGDLSFDLVARAPAPILDLIEDCFGDLPRAQEPDPPGEGPRLQIRVATDQRIDGQYLYRIDIEGIPTWHTDAPSAVVDHIVTSLTRLVLDHTVGRVHLHAGLVVGAHGGILITGPSGAGKSTVTAAAIRSGCTFVTDEMVSVDPATRRATGLLKPLTFKGQTWHLHADLLGDAPKRGDRWSVRASLLGSVADPSSAVVSGEGVPVRLIVLPHYEPSAEALTVCDVDPASAAVRLVTETLDMERNAVQAFETLVHFVSGARVVEVTYSNARRVGEWLAGHPGTTSTPTVVEQVPSVAPLGNLHRHRAPAVVSFLLNARVALYDEQRGLAADLDEAASLWWLAMDGHQSVTAIAQMFAEAVKGDRNEIENAGIQLIGELEQVGFVQ